MSRTDHHRPWRLRLDDPTDQLGVSYQPWHTHPPKWFRDYRFTNRARRDARDQLGAALKEHRGSGHTDREPKHRQHRYNATWDWN